MFRLLSIGSAAFFISTLVIGCTNEVSAFHVGKPALSTNNVRSKQDSFFIPSTEYHTTTSAFFIGSTPLHMKENEEDESSLLKKISIPISTFISKCLASKRCTKEEIEKDLAPWEKDLELRLEELQLYLESNETFAGELQFSIEEAKITAKNNLNPELYNAFLIGVDGWPSTLDSYFSFLTWFASYVPQQSNYDGWLNGTTQDYYSTHQEVYDRLCHFSYIINQPLPKSNKCTVQSNIWFAEWLVHYAQVWGKFCNTPDSISPQTIYSFYNNSKSFNVTDSMIPMNKEDIPGSVNKYTIYNSKGQPLKPNNPSGWMSWNQMFARELNPGLRPIDSPTKNEIICAPADCTFKATYPINMDNEVESHNSKRTHTIGNISDLLKGSKYAESFVGGTYVHYFLGPYSYHRFHTPVAGVVKECLQIPGLAYLDVNIVKTTGQFDAPDDSTNGYEFAQDRGLITIDTTDSKYGNVGIVAILPIGMCQVSSVNMIATPDAKLEKGEEFGYFQFGGSDIIMLFQKGVMPEANLFKDDKAYNHYGMQIGTATVLRLT